MTWGNPPRHRRKNDGASMPGCRGVTVCGSERMLTLRCDGTVVDTLVLSHCGNRQCDRQCGENEQNCPVDCEEHEYDCGRNGCEKKKGETPENCFRDCGQVDLGINGQGFGQEGGSVNVFPNTDYVVEWVIEAPANVQCTFTRNGSPWPPHPPPPMQGSRTDRIQEECGGGVACGECLTCKSSGAYVRVRYELVCSVPGQGEKRDSIIARAQETFCGWAGGPGCPSGAVGQPDIRTILEFSGGPVCER